MIDDRTLERVMPCGMVALTGDLVRATAWMLVVVLLLTFAGVYVRLAGLLLARPGANDFTILYYTAKMAQDERPMYGTVPDDYRLDWSGPHLGNLNPPHFQLLVAPLVPLGYHRAVVAWIAFNLAIVAACAWMVLRELRPALTLKRVLVTTLLVLGSAAWTSVAVTGEMSLVLLPPFTGAWVAARRERWAVAGALLGVAASLKVFLLVFGAWLVVSRRWRAVAAMAGGVAVPYAVGLAVYGDTPYVDWIRRLGGVEWWWLPMNASLRGVADRLLTARAGFAPLVGAPSLVWPTSLLAALAVVALTAWRTWPSRSGIDVDRVFATLLVAALLASPLGWVYYLPLATAPLLSLAMRRELAGPGAMRIALAVFALVFLSVPVEVTEKGQPSALATVVLACAYGWGALLLWTRLVLPDSPRRSEEAAA